MMEFFKQDNETQDVKMLRHHILQFIKNQLQRWEGGEGKAIRGMQLFVAPGELDKAMYESAVFVNSKAAMKEEVQRIADDYSIDLPEDWTLEVLFVDALPEGTVKAEKLPMAMYVSQHRQSAITRPSTAYINVLSGIAEHPHYVISSAGGKVCIGREKRVQTEGGFMRENTIAFPEGKHDSNKYVSRQHAHIEWNEETGSFYLYADEGGLPPRNKIKVKTADGELIKLQTIEIGYQLKEGDQVVLGDSALLQFTYSE